ncbi:MAG: efflux RND transporter periplasmic adaptor subunit [Paramuribaculum sp.]|nr:efflux RND transporter periplasmic adaptor subunit [Paramuribaculum sp.]
MSHRITNLAILSVSTALMLGSCSKSKNEQLVVVEEIPVVELDVAHSTEVPRTGEYTATVEAFKTNNISSSTPNRIKSIKVDVGSKVSAGEVLVVLDDASIEQLRVRLENMEREYNRAAKLLEIGGGTRQAVDNARTELEAARRQYDNLKENTILTSPISGVVTARNYDPGDMTGNLPILTVEQVKPLKVIVNISESEFTKVHEGMDVSLSFDVYGDERFPGKVYLIHPTIDPATRTFTVEVTIPNTDNRILPGMFARVYINFGTSNHVVVSDRAVVKQSGSANRYVYVFNPADSTVSYNKVELGQRIGDTYELLSGVNDNDFIVITGQTRLIDGSKVEVLKDK